MRRLVLVAIGFFLIVAAVGTSLYASAHPGQTRAAMEALRIWPTLTLTPRPTPTPTVTPPPTAIPSPTPTLLPARGEPHLLPNGAPGAGVGLQRPANPTAPVEWYDPTTGIDVVLRGADTKPFPGRVDEHGIPVQYIRIRGEEQYFGSDILLSTPWHFELRDRLGHIILPEPGATLWPTQNVPHGRRNPGRLVFEVPAGAATYAVYWHGDEYWAKIATVSIRRHALPRLVQSELP